MAVPFYDDDELSHYNAIEKHLLEVLTLLRWLPMHVVGEPTLQVEHNGFPAQTGRNPYVDRVIKKINHIREHFDREHQRQLSRLQHIEIISDRLRDERDLVKLLQRTVEEERRQQMVLPDLVTSSAVPATVQQQMPDLIAGAAMDPTPEPQPEPAPAPPAPEPVPLPPSGPRVRASAVNAKKRVKIGSIKLKLSPTADVVNMDVFVFPGDHLPEHVSLTEATDQQLAPPIDNVDDDNDEDSGYCTDIKRRLKSMFSASNIESSFITAAMVIIGMKIFVKQ